MIVPDWPAPARVRALMTTRAEPSAGGEGANRAALVRQLKLPAEPLWLRQVHGVRVVDAGASAQEPEADAAWTARPGVVCVAQAADCLPVLFCDDAGTVVAAAHAGWRGLCAGVLEATVKALPVSPARLMAWFGAAIGPRSFEVGAEVREAFLAVDRDAAQHFARHSRDPARHSRDPARHSRASGNPDKYLADLYGLARQRLARAGVSRVYGGGLDTCADRESFFSYRREGKTGRQCALVWLDLQENSVAPSGGLRP